MLLPRLKRLMPVDVIDLPVGKQRYGLLLTDEGTIIDDLMFFNQGVVDGEPTLFVIVNGACKVGDIAHIQARIGQRCKVLPMPDHALLALQGPQGCHRPRPPGTRRGKAGVHDRWRVQHCGLRLLCDPQRLHRRRRF
jgi:hypothetical protein